MLIHNHNHSIDENNPFIGLLVLLIVFLVLTIVGFIFVEIEKRDRKK